MKITFKQALPALVVLGGGAVTIAVLMAWPPEPAPSTPAVAPAAEETAGPTPASTAADPPAAGNKPAPRPRTAGDPGSTTETASVMEETAVPGSGTEPSQRATERERETTEHDSPPAPLRPSGSTSADSRSSTTTPLTTYVEPSAPGPPADQRLGRPIAEAEPAARPPGRRSRSRTSEESDVAGPAVVRMIPGASEYAVGDRVSIVIGVSSTARIAHVPFHVEFDPSVLQFELGEEGAFLGRDGAPTAFFASPRSSGGAVVVGLSRLGQVGGVEGDGELCVLHFIAVGPGDSALGFARATVRNAANRPAEGIFEASPVAVR